MGERRLIPHQESIPWAIAFQVSIAAIRRRLVRSLITMVGVILAIAFMAYMLVHDAFVASLIAAGSDELNVMLQRAGIDVFGGGQTDDMMVLLMILTILTCTIGITNSMLMSVAERIREIGTLKCLGARDQFIVKMYLIESLVHGMVGAALGAVLGAFVAFVVNLYGYGTYVFSEFPLLDVLAAVVVSFVVGTGMAVVSAIVPAYSAARKQPVEALRVEE